MTTIAWDGKTLAADKQGTQGDKAAYTVTKVFRRKDGALIAAVDNIALGMGFIRWFLKGEKGKAPPLKVEDEWTALLVIRKDGTMERHEPEGWFNIEGKFAAGSGKSLALLAMDLGATAEEAVKLASKYDVYTGSEIDTVTQ